MSDILGQIEQLEKLIALETQVSQLQAQLKQEKAEQHPLQQQLKELRKENPKRLKDQIKRLQEASRSSQKEVSALKASRKQKDELNAKLTKQIADLEQAASEEVANADVTTEQETLWENTIWAVYNGSEEGSYNLLCKPDKFSMMCTVVDGEVVVPELRTLPKTVMDKIRGIAKKAAEA
jgi:seryl-tRNA synthetase